MDARSLEDVIARLCPLVRQMLAAQACAIYLLLNFAETPGDEDAEVYRGRTGRSGVGGVGGGGGGGADTTPGSGGVEGRGKKRQVLRALVSGRAVEKYAANMMEAFLPPPEGLIRNESEIFDGAVMWEREELTHVMDLDVDPSRGLLVAALNADPDAPEGAAIVCPAPMEDARYDAPVDGAYFQRWVVGDDKELGASISIAIRHPNSRVVGVMQVCRSEGEDGFGNLDVELVSEAARLVGMRHASLMLEHSSFVDALDQAARPISRALDVGDDMLEELSRLQGLIQDLAQQAAHADARNLSPASPAASPSDATLPKTAARPAAHGGPASSAAPPDSKRTLQREETMPFAAACGGVNGLGAGTKVADAGAASPQSPRADGRGVARKLAVDNAPQPARASEGAGGGPSVSDAGAGGGAVASSGASAAGSVGSSSSSSRRPSSPADGVVAAHRDRFEREAAAAALAANAHAAPVKGLGARSISPAMPPAAGAAGGSSAGGASSGRRSIERKVLAGGDGDVQREAAGGAGGGSSSKQAAEDTVLPPSAPISAVRSSQSQLFEEDAPSPQAAPLASPAEVMPEMDEVFEVPRVARSLYDYDAVEPDELSISQ
jgi:GAF domain-containing protein